MNKVIWKFPLATADKQDISLPKGAEILCVQTQDDKPYLWALVEEGFTENRTFEIFGTGQKINYDSGTARYIDRKYIGSFQQQEGVFVWHVFELFNH